MTFETARAALELALKIPPAGQERESLGVIFFGGEPLLKRDLIRQIVLFCTEKEKATGQGFHFKITTNGSLLDEGFFTDPLMAEVFVAMSHDGVLKAHDRHRIDTTGKGTFEMLEPKIELLLKHKPYAPVMLVITPETVGCYAESVDWLFKKGFRYIICSLNYGVGWPGDALRELKKQYAVLANWYERLICDEQKFYFSPFDVKITSHIHSDSCLRERCELGRRQISVAPTGNLFPCVQFVGDGSKSALCIGDVNNGLDENRREDLFRQNAVEKVPCLNCGVRDRCNHFCGCLNKQATGTIHKVSPLLCANERMTIEVADRLAEKLFAKRVPMFIQKQYNDLFPLVSLAEDMTPKKGSSHPAS
jgi:uncharacterized protein